MIKHYCDKCQKEIEKKDKYNITIQKYKYVEIVLIL